MKDKKYFPHRYKLKRSAKRVPKPAYPRSQPSKETQPKEIVEITPVDPPTIVDPKTHPAHPVPEFRTVTMDQQVNARSEGLAREMIRRGDFHHLIQRLEDDSDGEGQRRGQGLGYRGKGRGARYGGQPRQDDRDRDISFRYSIRDIPTFDGKGDAMPHTHLIEFENFLMNAGSEINDLPPNYEPQPVDKPHYDAVLKDVVSKFKASLKDKPRLWFELQYPTANDESKTVQAHKNMLSLFTTEHNPIGSTREQKIMAWKTLKWDPAKEKLDDFLYKFRRVANELGYDADDNLEVFNCCDPIRTYTLEVPPLLKR